MTQIARSIRETLLSDSPINLDREALPLDNFTRVFCTDHFTLAEDEDKVKRGTADRTEVD